MRCGVSFVNSTSDLRSAPDTAVPHAISYYIGPLYNGTGLYIVYVNKSLKKPSDLTQTRTIQWLRILQSCNHMMHIFIKIWLAWRLWCVVNLSVTPNSSSWWVIALIPGASPLWTGPKTSAMRQNVRHFADGIFKWNSLKNIFRFKFCWSLFSKLHAAVNQHWLVARHPRTHSMSRLSSVGHCWGNYPGTPSSLKWRDY